MGLIKRIIRKIYGSYRMALKEGLNVGNNVSIVGSVNFGSEPYLITLGDNVRVSMDVMFINHDGGTWAFRDIDEYKGVIKYGKINVGAHTFIGARTIIMPGVTIGERCVIGAGSVVTKDIPDGMVACGVLAKPIMKTEEYARNCMTRMKPYNQDEYNKNKKDYLLKWIE